LSKLRLAAAAYTGRAVQAGEPMTAKLRQPGGAGDALPGPRTNTALDFQPASY